MELTIGRCITVKSMPPLIVHILKFLQIGTEISKYYRQPHSIDVEEMGINFSCWGVPHIILNILPPLQTSLLRV